MMLDPLGDGLSTVQLIDRIGDDGRIVDAARVSLAGDGREWREEADPRLIRYMLKHGHWSPFEHCVVTLMVKCPLFIRAQWMRHRSMSFNEISARYTEVPDEFYTPVLFRAQSSNNRQASVDPAGRIDQATCHAFYHDAIKESVEVYRRLLEEGVTREQARAVLPQAAYTRFYVTANLRSWLHFLAQRDHPGAQHEMILYARAVRDLLEPLFPVTFREWGVVHASS